MSKQSEAIEARTLMGQKYREIRDKKRISRWQITQSHKISYTTIDGIENGDLDYTITSHLLYLDAIGLREDLYKCVLP